MKSAAQIILHPVGTEKAIRLLDQNKLVFAVDRDARKPQIKEAIESMFGEKVADIKTMIDVKGVKKAYINFKKDGSAIELATNLGLL